MPEPTSLPLPYRPPCPPPPRLGGSSLGIIGKGDPSGCPVPAPAGDGLAAPVDRVSLSVPLDGLQPDGPAGEGPDDPEADPDPDPARPGETASAERPDRLEVDGHDSTLPPLRLATVWEALPRMRKSDLQAVVEEYGVGLWIQFGQTVPGHRLHSSMKKAEMLQHARRVVRHHAALDAAHCLEEGEVEALYDWMRSRLSAPERTGENAGRTERDPDLWIAARLFWDFLAGAALSADGRGLSPEPWNRYREAELRRIGALCYPHFYEERVAG